MCRIILFPDRIVFKGPSAIVHSIFCRSICGLFRNDAGFARKKAKVYIMLFKVKIYISIQAVFIVVRHRSE